MEFSQPECESGISLLVAFKLECDYAASQKSHLKQHMESVHENIKNHACSECDFVAYSRQVLYKHIESIHRVGGKKLRVD